VLQDILKKIIILYSIITKIVHPFLDDIEIWKESPALTDVWDSLGNK
jgi:hypothetical protein